MQRFLPYLRLMRPHQWLKNAFVFVGLIFGHGWTDAELVRDAFTLFAAFCLASSAVYAANDIADREADRAHPQKRNRPLASGEITPRSALAACLLLGLAGLALSAWVSWQALVIAGCYLALNAGYNAGLKHVAVLDVFLIAAGFMLRILAGTIGLGIEPSNWLLFCGLMLTLFLGFSKRRAEFAGLDGAVPNSAPGTVPQRPALAGYSTATLDRMLAITAAGTAIGYGLYTVDTQTVLLHGTDKLILTLPFVLYGLFRYLFVVHRRGGGADPAWELLHDPHLLAAVAGWFALTCWVLAR